MNIRLQNSYYYMLFLFDFFIIFMKISVLMRIVFECVFLIHI
ncbi:hypothetical protein SAMN02745781_00260 [Vibrio gazogenes DSM 21264]|uniref:Uncharacterized protein n=1 Tax=Vibrio gazogenes DSM 21264 = NBRC 103151 TaxID=1123492 RepID=A0A1M4T8R3_VIBGA|nr:hypothetical protein SAMN02745781_00260 [Vibrio gazogenes DSM 21264] [Vibrio gazogenes DSM 21264 = NBRC 103151]SJN54308.1 hypothetical protein BQ6471_00943 [Vibrio gazogenes]